MVHIDHRTEEAVRSFLSLIADRYDMAEATRDNDGPDWSM